MTSKERAALKSLATKEEAIFQIGKEESDSNQLKGIAEALVKRELVKITVLKSCAYEPKEILSSLCEKLSAEPVAAIGNKIILYKKNPDKYAARIKL